jgi:hypothetical protein
MAFGLLNQASESKSIMQNEMKSLDGLKKKKNEDI